MSFVGLPGRTSRRGVLTCMLSVGKNFSCSLMMCRKRSATSQRGWLSLYERRSKALSPTANNRSRFRLSSRPAAPCPVRLPGALSTSGRMASRLQLAICRVCRARAPGAGLKTTPYGENTLHQTSVIFAADPARNRTQNDAVRRLHEAVGVQPHRTHGCDRRPSPEKRQLT